MIDQSLSNMRLTQYWDFKFEEDSSKIKEEEYIEELQHLLEQAISRQLVSDVKGNFYILVVAWILEQLLQFHQKLQTLKVLQ